MMLTRRLLLPRPPSFMISAALPLALRNAGTRPEAIVASRVIATVKTSTDPSIVNCPIVRCRKGQRVNRPNEEIDRPIGDDHARDRPEHRDDQTLGQHLSHESPPRRAECAANRQFLCAQRGPPELHVHHVHTGDQQHENDRGEHRPDGLTKLDAGERIQQRLHTRRRQILIRLGIVLCQMASKAINSAFA